MEWIGSLLALIGLGSDRQTRTIDKRQEAYRLLAEANGEVQRCLFVAQFAEAQLTRRLETLAPEATELQSAITTAFAKVCQDCEAAQKVLADLRAPFDKATGAALDRALVGLVELHVASRNFVPWVDGIALQFNDVLDNAVAAR